MRIVMIENSIWGRGFGGLLFSSLVFGLGQGCECMC